MVIKTFFFYIILQTHGDIPSGKDGWFRIIIQGTLVATMDLDDLRGRVETGGSTCNFHVGFTQWWIVKTFTYESWIINDY